MGHKIILVVDSLDDQPDRLRRLIEEAGCKEVRFAAPEHWRDCLNGVEPGAIVISDQIPPAQRRRLIGDVTQAYPGVPLVRLGDETESEPDSA